jgi:predicted amidohydrolase
MTVKIAVCQTICAPGDIEANIGKGVEMVREAAGRGAKLMVLPECFTTGAPVGGGAPTAEPVPGPSVEKLGAAARAARAFVIYGTVEKNASGKPFNSAVLLDPQGSVAAVYRKAQLYLNEADDHARGDRRCVADLGFCKAGITICYDYIFPEYIRALVDAGARLLVHSTNWLNTGECERWHYNTDAYRAVCIARAIENTIFVASANRFGPCGGGTMHSIGQSAIIAPWGEILAEVRDGEGVAVAECDFERIEGWQQAAAPYLRDRKHTPSA